MDRLLPDDVKAEICAHIQRGVEHAESGWDAAHDDEDTLTGELGGALRTDGFVTCALDRSWTYRVTYKKLRGKGPNAPETLTGADGIFQIEVRRQGKSKVDLKGFLFQAKKRDSSSRSDLVGQVNDLERIAPGGSAIVEYSDDGFRAQTGAEFKIARSKSSARIPHPDGSLSSFLCDRFLTCETGLRGLYFDAVRGNLVVPKLGGSTKTYKVSVEHRISVEAVQT